VEPILENYKEILQQDVENFQNMIMDYETFRLSFKSSVSDNMSREFSGVLNYNKLVRLRNRFIYQTTDVVRLICFRREAIENAIFKQDLINSQQRGDKRILSYYFKDSCNWGGRDQSNPFFRLMAVSCKKFPILII